MLSDAPSLEVFFRDFLELIRPLFTRSDFDAQPRYIADTGHLWSIGIVGRAGNSEMTQESRLEPSRCMKPRNNGTSLQRAVVECPVLALQAVGTGASLAKSTSLSRRAWPRQTCAADYMVYIYIYIYI